MISNMFPKIVLGRGSDLQLLLVYPSWLTSYPKCSVLPPSTMDDLVKRFEADVLRLTRKPFAMLRPEGKVEHLTLVERVTRALDNDGDATLSVTSTGVVMLTCGCLDSELRAMRRPERMLVRWTFSGLHGP